MEQILGQILSELQALREGQAKLSEVQSRQGEDLTSLKKDVSEIKAELRFVWEDVKKLDKRLTAQGEELVILKRLK